MSLIDSLKYRLYLRLSQTFSHDDDKTILTESECTREDLNFLEPLLHYLDEIEAQKSAPIASVHDLYFDPSAFDAFCREGGNCQLYDRLTAQIAAFLNEIAQDPAITDPDIVMLDIGCGSGRALLPILSQYRGLKPLKVIGVEPSQAMVDELLATWQTQQAQWPHIHVEIRCQTLQQYMLAPVYPSYHLAMATFSLSSQQKDARAPLLHWIQAHAATFLLAEFDSRVPEVATVDPQRLLTPERFSAILRRYVIGAQEHVGSQHEQLILRGFLFPAFLGNFKSSPRFTFEQSLEEWVKELAEVGFTHIQPQHCAPFWWDQCILFQSKSNV